MRPNVGSQPSAQGAGQVVHEWHIAEEVAATEEDTVCFEGEKAVRGVDGDATAGLRHPQGLPQRGPLIADVLQDLVKEDKVEDVVGEGEVLGDRQSKVRDLPAAA